MLIPSQLGNNWIAASSGNDWTHASTLPLTVAIAPYHVTISGKTAKQVERRYARRTQLDATIDPTVLRKS